MVHTTYYNYYILHTEINLFNRDMSTIFVFQVLFALENIIEIIYFYKSQPTVFNISVSLMF